jgi:hypothetical protein
MSVRSSSGASRHFCLLAARGHRPVQPSGGAPNRVDNMSSDRRSSRPLLIPNIADRSGATRRTKTTPDAVVRPEAWR